MEANTINLVACGLLAVSSGLAVLRWSRVRRSLLSDGYARAAAREENWYSPESREATILGAHEQLTYLSLDVSELLSFSECADKSCNTSITAFLTASSKRDVGR